MRTTALNIQQLSMDLGGELMVDGVQSRRFRIGVISSAPPTSHSGQGMVLRRLIGAAGLERCIVFTDSTDPKRAAELATFPGEIVRLPRQNRTLSRRFAKKFHKSLVGLGLSPPWRTPSVSQMSKTANLIAESAKGLDCLVACSGALTDIPMAAQAARASGARLILYIFDDYVGQQTHVAAARWALEAEQQAVGLASAVICPNEQLAELYRARHGVKPTIVRNPNVGAGAATEVQADIAPTEIVYTGSIYDAQRDSVERTVAAVRAVGGGYRLIVYSANAPEAAPTIAFEPEVAWRSFLDSARTTEVQRAAGILLLPLSFLPEMAPVVRTAAPGKLGEYLASGRPILLHAPADSFVAGLLSAHDAAELVTEPDVKLLASAIRRLRDDPEHGARIAANASRLAEEFSLPRCVEMFVGALRADQPRPALMEENR